MLCLPLSSSKTNHLRAVLDASGTAAFQRYLDSGGNFIGIHAAADCLVNTSFYGREVGTSASPL